MYLKTTKLWQKSTHRDTGSTHESRHKISNVQMNVDRKDIPRYQIVILNPLNRAMVQLMKSLIFVFLQSLLPSAGNLSSTAAMISFTRQLVPHSSERIHTVAIGNLVNNTRSQSLLMQ